MTIWRSDNRGGGVLPTVMTRASVMLPTDDRAIRLALAWTARSGEKQWLDPLMTASTGRPRVVSPSLCLTLIRMHLIHSGEMSMADVARRVEQMNTYQRVMLDVPEDFTYENLVATFNAIAQVLTRIRSRVDPLTGEVTGAPSVEAAATRMLAGSIPAEYGVSTDQALDSTDVTTWAKPWFGEKKAAMRAGFAENLADDGVGSDLDDIPRARLLPVCDDVDARIGWRSRKPGKTGFFCGYDAHIMTDIPVENISETPMLARAICLAPAGASKSTAGISVVDAFRETYGFYPAVLASDRGYTPSKPHKWAYPLAIRGIVQSIDLHLTQRKAVYDAANNCVWICGWPYTAAMPESLWKDEYGTTRVFDSPIGVMDESKREAILATYQALEPWAFRSMGQISKDGVRRFRAPKVRCRLRRDTMSLPYDYPVTTCGQRNTGCHCPTRQTISATIEDHGREQQRYRYGSSQWWEDYKRRITVERYNAELRTNRGHLTDGAHRFLGLVKNTIWMALYTGATNIRYLLDLYDHHPDLQPVEQSPGETDAHVVKTHPLNRPVKIRHRKPRKPARATIKQLAKAPPG